MSCRCCENIFKFKLKVLGSVEEKKHFDVFDEFSAFFDVKHSLNNTLLKDRFKPMYMIDLEVSKTTICVKGRVTSRFRKFDN